MEAQQAYHALLKSPMSFLRTRVLMINGGGQDKVMQYEMGSVGHNASTGFEKYKLGAGTAVGVTDGYKFDAHNVRMIPATEALNFGQIPGYTVTFGTPILLTGQLSGCCFCFAQGPKGLVVAHIQPGGARGDGNALQDAVKNGGRFAGMPGTPVQTWGARDYGQGGKASVIGVNTSGAWELYGQVLTGVGTGVTRVDQML